METNNKTPAAIAKALTETIAVVRTKASTLRLTIFGTVLIMYRSELCGRRIAVNPYVRL